MRGERQAVWHFACSRDSITATDVREHFYDVFDPQGASKALAALVQQGCLTRDAIVGHRGLLTFRAVADHPPKGSGNYNHAKPGRVPARSKADWAPDPLLAPAIRHLVPEVAGALYQRAQGDARFETMPLLRLE